VGGGGGGGGEGDVWETVGKGREVREGVKKAGVNQTKTPKKTNKRKIKKNVTDTHNKKT